jgi:nitrogen fixation NifU-like protein
MSLDGLYREIILDHYQNPRNRGALDDADTASHGLNPLCGDEVDVFLKLDGDRIAAIGITGRGCSISQATGSMMSDSVKGHSLAEAREMARAFKGMMTEGGSIEDRPEMADMEALQGVKQFPVRIKCTLLPWTTLTDALDRYAAHGGDSNGSTQ